MNYLIYILSNMITPIMLIVAVGYITAKLMRIEITTLSRINIYVFVPAFIFAHLYEMDLASVELGKVIGLVLTLMIALYIVAEIAGRILEFPISMKRSFTNSVIFFNSGNYGLPLAELVFHANPIALSIQVMIVTIQNITINTLGIFNASSGKGTIGAALKNISRIPSIYAVPLALMLNILQVRIPQPVMTSADYLAGGLIPVALFTLGVQLSRVRFRLGFNTAFISVLFRLILAPAIAFILVKLFHIDGLTAQVLIIGASVPTAVNTTTIAIEFGNEPEFASQAVFYSTLLSAITVTAVIYLVL